MNGEEMVNTVDSPQVEVNDVAKNEERTEANNERYTNISCENRAYDIDIDNSVV